MVAAKNQPVDVPGTILEIDGNKVWVKTTAGRVCVAKDKIKLKR